MNSWDLTTCQISNHFTAKAWDGENRLLVELAKESFPKINHLIGDFSHYLILAMLIDGRTPARIWVNDIEKPVTVFVWDQLNTLLFILGDSTDHTLNRKLNETIMDTIFPEANRLQYRKLFFQFYSPDTWEDKIGVVLNQFDYYQRFIYSYMLNPKHSNDTLSLKSEPPDGYQLKRITRELLGDSDLKNLAEILYCIEACWQTTDNYLKNGGIGFCCLKDDVIASWCSTDYVIDNACELYVETFEGFKQKGLGTLVALSCVQECLAQGLNVHWHCFDYALGSVKIAEKINLAKIAECPVYIVDLAREHSA